MRYPILTLLLLFGLATAFCQIPNNNLTDYTTARQGLVVLSNKQQLLPVSGLDGLRIVLFTYGFEENNELYRTLNTYLPTAEVSWQSTDTEIKYPPSFPNSEAKELSIIAVNQAGLDGAQVGFSPLRGPADRNANELIIWFGGGPEAAALDPSRFHTILYSEENSAWAQSLAAQLLFGAIGCDQRLSKNVSRYFPVGSGVTVEGNNRLGFAPPALLDINTKLLQDSIQRIVADGLQHQAFPGAQVLVAKGGTIVYHEAFGFHTDQEKQPVQKTDLYDLASITKITSALPALIKWYSEGSFELDAPLANYYPAASKSNKADLSFRAMLSHHARLRPWIPYWQATLRGNGKYPWSRARDPERINDYRFRRKTLARDSSDQYSIYLSPELWQHRDYRQKMMKAIMKSPLNETAEYRYSGLLFYLLPEIVEQRTEMPYEDYLSQTFYRPLGAYTLGFNPSRYFPPERIIPTERDSFFRMQLLHGYVHDEGAAMMGGLSANAGLFANAYDLAKIMQLYLNGGTYAGQQFFSASAMDTFTQRHYAAEGNRRGLGFDKPLLEYDAASSSVAEAASDSSFGHSGYTGTFTWADPEHDLLFIFLSNRVYPSRKNRGIYIRNIRPRIHSAIYEALPAQ